MRLTQQFDSLVDFVRSGLKTTADTLSVDRNVSNDRGAFETSGNCYPSTECNIAESMNFPSWIISGGN